MGESREFSAGHGRPAKEERTLFAREKFRCRRSNADFGAAGVGHERMSRCAARDFRKQINGRGDGERDVDQIGVMQGRRQLTGEGFVNGTASLCFTSYVGTFPS